MVWNANRAVGRATSILDDTPEMREALSNLIRGIEQPQPQIINDGLPRQMSGYDIGQQQMANPNVTQNIPQQIVKPRMITLQDLYGSMPMEQAETQLTPTIRDIPQEQQPEQQPEQQGTLDDLLKQPVEEITKQMKETQKQIKKLTLGDIIGGLMKPVTDPLINEQGETSNVMDMMRFVANTQAPALGQIWEQQIAKAQSSAEADAARKYAMEDWEHQQAVLNEYKMQELGIKNMLDEMTRAGEIPEQENKLIMNRMDKLSDNSGEFAGFRSVIADASMIKDLVASNSSFAWIMVEAKLIRMAGDNRVTDNNRQQARAALSWFDRTSAAFKQNVKGDRLTEKGKKELNKLVNTFEGTVKENINSYFDKEGKFLKELGVGEERVDRVLDMMKEHYLRGNEEQITMAQGQQIINALQDRGATKQEIELVKKELGL